MSRKGKAMVTFRLRYYQWDDNLNLDGACGEGPIFHVYTGATDLAFAIAVFMAAADVSMLRQEIALQEETRSPSNDPLRTAVVRFAVARIAQGLKDGLFLAFPTHAPPFPLPVEEADLPAIRQLLQAKTCTYQTRQGRDLLCSVASVNDPTRRGADRREYSLLHPPPASYAVRVRCPIPIIYVPI